MYLWLFVVLMYDKVSLWIHSEQYQDIGSFLDDGKQEVDLKTGETWITGGLGNLKVSIYPVGFSVVGSLAKYLFGSNVYSMDRNTTAQAIEKISDSLHIRMEIASVSSFEFGGNFEMKHQVQSYLERMGEMPRLSRYHFEPSTLYYKGTGKRQPKVFAFYDKIADAIVKGMEYQESMKDANLLRYEMRLKGRLSQQMGVPEVKASTLYDLEFYRKVLKLYQDSYSSIKKTEPSKNQCYERDKKRKRWF